VRDKPIAGHFERDGWRICFPSANGQFPASLRDELMERAFSVIKGRGGAPFRRSRHATSYCVHVGPQGEGGRDVFLKLIEGPRGLGRLKNLIRGSRARHVARVTEALHRAGVHAPPLVVFGQERNRGRSLIGTERFAGQALPRFSQASGSGDEVLRKRALLHALGTEIARLHRAGFIHGDLTPYNVLVARGEPPRFIFIDHERTRRALSPGCQRARLRNLVQLGRFDIPGLTRTDRMRVFRAYVDTLAVRARKALRRQAAAMLAARLARDRAMADRRIIRG
jgi:Lipopolysaccharide kinase (Kdo/WaaP) family